MPGKMARSALDHRSGCPLRWWPSSPRACLAGRPEIRQMFTQFGSHQGESRLIGQLDHLCKAALHG